MGESNKCGNCSCEKKSNAGALLSNEERYAGELLARKLMGKMENDARLVQKLSDVFSNVPRDRFPENYGVSKRGDRDTHLLESVFLQLMEDIVEGRIILGIYIGK